MTVAEAALAAEHDFLTRTLGLDRDSGSAARRLTGSQARR
jgi:hypothetical protein